MARRLLVPALAALAALPAAAQPVAQHSGDATTVAASAIDPQLVGRWELVEVEDLGTLEDLDARVEAMACHFGADGQASVGMTIEQDADRYVRERSFRFTAADGRIATDGTDSAAYEIVDAEEVRLTMAGGFVARLRRVDV